MNRKMKTGLLIAAAALLVGGGIAGFMKSKKGEGALSLIEEGKKQAGAAARGVTAEAGTDVSTGDVTKTPEKAAPETENSFAETENSSAETERNAADVKDKTPDLGLNVRYVRVSWSEDGAEKFCGMAAYNPWDEMEGPRTVPAVIIRSTAEAQSFYQTLADDFCFAGGYDGKPSMEETWKCYDDAFFREHALVILYQWEGSGSVRHEVSAELKEEGLYVTVTRKVPEVFTCDMAGWMICLEMNKDALKGVTAVLAGVE